MILFSSHKKKLCLLPKHSGRYFTLNVLCTSVCVGGESGHCRLEKLLSTNPRRQERAQGPLVIDGFSHLNSEPKAEA